MKTKPKILFVNPQDISKKVTDLIETYTDNWELFFCKNGEDVLDILKNASFSIVFSEIRLPDMPGIKLFDMILELHPNVIRIFYSDDQNRDDALKSTGPSHHFIKKTANGEELTNLISRMVQLDEKIRSNSNNKIITKIKSIPSIPSLYLKLVNEINSEDSSVSSVSEIISKDMGMTAKILKLVNSAYFGVSREVHTPLQAIMMLGINTIKPLVLSYQLFSNYQNIQVKNFNLNTLWKYSLLISTFSRNIALIEQADENTVDDSMIVGLLNGIGILIFASNFPEPYEKVLGGVKESDGVLVDAEKEEFGTNNVQMGSFILDLWGFSPTVINALKYIYNPLDSPDQFRGVLTYTHAAIALLSKLLTSSTLYNKINPDMDYLDSIGLGNRLDIWEEICKNILENNSSMM